MTQALLSALLTVILLGSQAHVPASAPPDDDIVVVGQRMRRIKILVKTDRATGMTRCLVKRRSGDDAFDEMMCNAARSCTVGKKAQAEIEACIKPRVDAYVHALAARRPDANVGR